MPGFLDRVDIAGSSALQDNTMKTDFHFGIYKQTWWCRWCGSTYKPLKQTDRDGFCPGGKCRMALHRAYRKQCDKALLVAEVRKNKLRTRRNKRTK